MKTILMLGTVLGVAAVLVATAFGDIVVLNNGLVYIGKVSSAPSGRLKLTIESGDQFFSKDQVANFWVTTPGMEAEPFYQAGVLVLGKGQQDTARQLFERCIKYDPNYRDKCVAALRGGAPASPPTSPAVGRTPVVGPPAPQTTAVRVQCGACSGTGVVMSTSRLNQEGGTQRPRPCVLCGGKGFKDMQLPQGYDVCSECGGFGLTVSSSSSGGSSERTGFAIRTSTCPRCAGRGMIKSAWKPAEGEGSGTGTPTFVSTGSSPSPGTAPTGVYNIARDRARAVASGRQPERPIGPPAISPVSPTILENPPPAEKTEEIVDEGAGSSSDTATKETTKESKSKKSDSASNYAEPGLVGWVSRHKWYIVLGGVVLLTFAVVFNKMSGKK